MRGLHGVDENGPICGLQQIGLLVTRSLFGEGLANLGASAVQFRHPLSQLVFASGPHPPHRSSEEHTSELQSQSNHVCRLLLEKKKTITCKLGPYRLAGSRSSSCVSDRSRRLRSQSDLLRHY